MYIQENINRAFRVFRQDPSTENRDALVAECKELINVVLCTTPDWVSEDPETEEEIRTDVLVLFMKFLDRHKDFDKITNPSAFLFGFVKRSALNCLEARYPSKLCSKCKGTGLIEGATCQVCLGKRRVSLRPDQLPTTEKDWTVPGVKNLLPLSEEELKRVEELRLRLRGKRKKVSEFYRKQGGRCGPARGKVNKETEFFLNLIDESFREFFESTRTEQGKKDWELDRKMMLEEIVRKSREQNITETLTRIKPYPRKARFSKKTR